MTKRDDWLFFHRAVEDIVHECGVSVGKAQSMLRAACASGVIQSEKEPYTVVGGEALGEGPPTLIQPSEWREHEIDMMTDKDGCYYFVRIDEPDFRYWLKQQNHKQATGKQSRILSLLAQIFPNVPVPPKDVLPRKVLRADLLKLDPSLAPLDEATLKTAIDTHNALIRNGPNRIGSD
jgi:hypothetical protein